ncbi:MAG: recombinase family protein [Phycisphaerales bacterium]|nr:MAG: recombinase family protein [Phycisphaerales bacterium]
MSTKRGAPRQGPPTIRCAIYTRKSTEEGLEQEFNSLDAQRESAEAYIASQKAEGWVCLPDRYDDGGFTGGNMERPALRRLMADMEAGRVDCVVVYKVDRLSRSLMDFARMMELFERQRISFVSVTQQFNTTQSMGRLTLNILLSFAQFEREIISERTRDKIAAARRKGKWSGGRSVLGYDIDPDTKRLVVNAGEAKLVREIFGLYLEQRSLLAVSRAFNARGLTTKRVVTKRGKVYGGRAWDKPAVLAVLTNVLYAGRVRYKTETYAGEHEAIVDEAVWARTQETLRFNGRTGGMHQRNKHSAVLKGLLHCAPCGAAMGHTATVNGSKDRLYRYYVCYKAQKQGWDACPCRSLPAEQIERFVIDRVREVCGDPEVRSRTLAACRRASESKRDAAQADLAAAERDAALAQRELGRVAGDAATSPHATARLADLHTQLAGAQRSAEEASKAIAAAEAEMVLPEEVDAALADFDGVWSRLSPKQQVRLVRLLVQRVDYDAEKGSVSIAFQPLGLRRLLDQEVMA